MTTSKRTSVRDKELGAFYTPKNLSIWLIEHVKASGFKPAIILDPAAGGGALLEAAELSFPGTKLFGLDLDKRAHQVLDAAGWAMQRSAADALLKDDWFENSADGKRLIFSNPPWGAKISAATASDYKLKYRNAFGSFDIFDLFIEKTLDSLRDGDWAALFLPDSLLLPNHARTRRMIQEKTAIHSLTRLPEGVFPGVAMGSLALVLEKGTAKPKHKVRFARLNRADYFGTQVNAANIENLRIRAEVKVSQYQWMHSSAATWQANDFENSEVKLPSSLVDHDSQTFGSTWDIWFDSGRGIEVGKKALVKVVPPVSVSSDMIPVAVGEDVNRRSVMPTRLLDLGVHKAVSLKQELGEGPRLLVRKTGIGIKACVASGIATTQTIYHFRPKQNAPEYALHYAAGFLSSRVIIAIHLAKTGETEWRSHPYVTQRVIRDLQLPIPERFSEAESLAKEIALTSKVLHEREDSELEEKLDLAVAKLLGGGINLVRWAERFLDTVTGCSYTKQLLSYSASEKSA